MAAAVLYLLAAYAAASVWECLLHRHVLHAPAAARRRWRRWGQAGALLRLAHFYHQGIHHGRTFRRSLLVQFNEPGQRRRIDARLPDAIGARVRANRYGLSVSGPWEFAAFTAVPLAVNTGLGVVACPALTGVGMAIAVVPFLLSRYVHPWLHEPPRAGAHPAFRFLQRYHLTHHRLGRHNYNLLPGADWLLGEWHRNRRGRHRRA